MRDTIWFKSRGIASIPMLLMAISMAACRSDPPSQPNADTNTLRQAQPVTQPPPEVPAPDPSEKTVAAPEDQGSKESTREDVEALPTVPTVPIASLTETEASPTDTETENPDFSQSPESSLKGEPQSTEDILAKGTFVSGKNLTQGGVVVLDDEGTPVIQLGQDFQTVSGPDLVIVLHQAVNPIKEEQTSPYALVEGEYVEIAPLNAIQGKQHYSIPAAIILDNYNSVAIWCRTFNATFGAASLR